MGIVMGNFMEAVALVLNKALEIYMWIIIIAALLSWVNPDPYNPVVRILRNLTQPVFSRVRRWLPFSVVGGIDLSPVVVILAIYFLQAFVVQTLYQLARGAR